MEERHTGLSENEWYIMQVLWKKSPRSLREICEALKPVKGWTRHAVISFLKRMEVKGAVGVDESGKVKEYRALWDQEKTVREETDSLLQRVYGGNLMLMVSNAVKGQELTEGERNQLRQLLEEMED
ncbi:MAG: BlaI/MecI/CopY family transcriptional regulator [Eubacteriales bacterium]|nr:BlaI/MecI/CopY family transcriptional regulator [Eubacteriales bacterium]